MWVIYKLLERRKWSKKVAKRQYTEQDEALRDWWLGHQLNLDARRLVFLDESGSNRRTAFRRFGWAPIGRKPVHQISSSRGEKWSILPAITLDGYLEDPLVCTGSVKQALFNEWVIDSILPQLRPDWHIIILDNASIHKDPRLIEACREYGVEVQFLPPYCPEFNPIELSFNELKAWIRRNKDLIAEFESFGLFLQHGLQQVASPQASRGYFRKAGYGPIN